MFMSRSAVDVVVDGGDDDDDDDGVVVTVVDDGKCCCWFCCCVSDWLLTLADGEDIFRMADQKWRNSLSCLFFVTFRR